MCRIQEKPRAELLELNVSLNHQGCGQNAGSDSADLESSGFCIFLTSSQVMGPLQVSRPTGAGGWSGSRVAKGSRPMLTWCGCPHRAAGFHSMFLKIPGEMQDVLSGPGARCSTRVRDVLENVQQAGMVGRVLIYSVS